MTSEIQRSNSHNSQYECFNQGTSNKIVNLLCEWSKVPCFLNWTNWNEALNKQKKRAKAIRRWSEFLNILLQVTSLINLIEIWLWIGELYSSFKDPLQFFLGLIYKQTQIHPQTLIRTNCFQIPCKRYVIRSYWLLLMDHTMDQ